MNEIELRRRVFAEELEAVDSTLGIPNQAMNETIGTALIGGPGQWLAVKRLRRDTHEPDAGFWLHRRSCRFSTV
jgi:hypothetical protein